MSIDISGNVNWFFSTLCFSNDEFRSPYQICFMTHQKSTHVNRDVPSHLLPPQLLTYYEVCQLQKRTDSPWFQTRMNSPWGSRWDMTPIPMGGGGGLCTFDVLQENISKHNFTSLEKNHILGVITFWKAKCIPVMKISKRNVPRTYPIVLC